MKQIHSLTDAVKILKSGGILAHPADTCFGLTGDLMNEKAMRRIHEIKGRDGGKPMSIFIRAGSYELGAGRKSSKLQAPSFKLSGYVELSPYAEDIFNKLLPGAVTMVLPKGPKIPKWYFPETEWVGIRMVEDERVNQLLEEFGGPLITTSANLSGQPACYSVKEVEKAFEKSEVKPDGILTGEIADPKPPSTVIKIVNDRVEVLREGPVKIEGLS